MNTADDNYNTNPSLLKTNYLFAIDLFVDLFVVDVLMRRLNNANEIEPS